jgi:hypothetical protein
MNLRKTKSPRADALGLFVFPFAIEIPRKHVIAYASLLTCSVHKRLPSFKPIHEDLGDTELDLEKALRTLGQ